MGVVGCRQVIINVLYKAIVVIICDKRKPQCFGKKLYIETVGQL